MVVEQTCEGVGKVWVAASGLSVLKRATNLALILFAATPETWKY